MARELDIRPLTATRDDLENNYSTKPLNPAELCIESDRRDTWVGDVGENIRIGLRPYYGYAQQLATQSHNQRSFVDANTVLSFSVPVDGVYEISWSAIIESSSNNADVFHQVRVGGTVVEESRHNDIDSGTDARVSGRTISSFSAGAAGTVYFAFYANRGTPALRNLHLSIERKF